MAFLAADLPMRLPKDVAGVCFSIALHVIITDLYVSTLPSSFSPTGPDSTEAQGEPGSSGIPNVLGTLAATTVRLILTVRVRGEGPVGSFARCYTKLRRSSRMCTARWLPDHDLRPLASGLLEGLLMLSSPQYRPR